MNILVLDDEELSLATLKRETQKVFPNADIVPFQSAGEAIKYADDIKNRGGTIDYAFCD